MHSFPSQDWNKCSVGCEFGFSATKTPDATFGIAPDPTVESILRSMESSQYYSENNIAVARGWVRTKLILVG
jgi:glycoprotein 3-alpha-L-fucosyltransferase